MNCFRTRLALAAAFLVLGLASRGAAEPPPLVRVNVFEVDGKDPRAPYRNGRDGPDFAIARISTVNKIRTPDGTFARAAGTGWLISPCLLMTNYHVVFGTPRSGESIDSADYPVVVKMERATRRGVPVAWRDPVQEDGTFERRSDIALVEISPCATVSEHPLDIDASPFPTLSGEPVLMVAFHGDADYGGPAFTRCRITGWDPAKWLLHHDCASQPGSSGAPIISTRTGKVVALHSSTQHAPPGLIKFEPRFANVAIPMEAIWLGAGPTFRNPGLRDLRGLPPVPQRNNLLKMDK